MNQVYNILIPLLDLTSFLLFGVNLLTYVGITDIR